MKGKILKKLLASALALMLVAGAAPIPQISDLFGDTVIAVNAREPGTTDPDEDEEDISVNGSEWFTVNEEGTQYTIRSAEGWDVFCECMEDASFNGFEGKTVLLADNISVTTQAGSEENGFKGTFDGNGKTITVSYTAAGEFCSPFPLANGAAFKNLNVAGTISTNYGFAAGLTGHTKGSVTIQSCQSHIDIDSTSGSAGGFVGLSEDDILISDCLSCAVIKSGEGNNSGFIAWAENNDKVINIEGSLFNGKILKKGSNGGCNGAFIGWKGNLKKALISYCMCDPDDLLSDEDYADDNSFTFSRQNTGYEAVLTNCYYLFNFGAEQGLECKIVVGSDVYVSPEGEEINYSTSGLKCYRDNNGMYYNNLLYVGVGEKVALSLEYFGYVADGMFVSAFTVNNGILENNVLTMPDTFVIVRPVYTDADECLFDEETGTLTLKGNVSASDVSQYFDNTSIIVVDKDGCVLPVNSESLFEGFDNVSKIDLTGADASLVQNMHRIFYSCSSLEELNLGSIDTGNVRYMDQMFYECNSLMNLDVSALDTGKVTDMSAMFYGCISLKELDVSTFDMSSVQDTTCMFSNCSNLNTLVIGEQHPVNNINMSEMFAYCPMLKNLDLSGFETSSVTDMHCLFRADSSLKSINLSSIGTACVSDMNCMFSDCSALEDITFGSGFDTSSVTDMSEMFSGCQKISTLDLSFFDTARVTDMSYMFFGCQNLGSVDLSGFDTRKVEQMHYMFYNCSSLTNLDLSSFDTRKVKDMGSMFELCASLKELDISRFDTSSLTCTDCMFRMQGSSRTQLATIYAGKNCDMSQIEKSTDMFLYCKYLEGGQGTNYSFDHRNSEYARIDEGSSKPGYFTASTYDVSVTPSENGTVTPDQTANILVGDTVKLTVNAASGYSLYSLTVKDANGSKIKVRNNQFVMPPSDVTVSAVFKNQGYTVVWKNGDEILETDTDVAAGEMPSYDGMTPCKAPDAQYTYEFIGWSPEIAEVTGNAVYTAVFKENVFVNTSSIDANDIELGGSVTVTASSSGGYGECRYALDYKAAGETSWTRAVDLSTNTSFDFAPTAAGKYSLRFVARDERNINAYRYVNLLVHSLEALTNSMTVSSSESVVGDAVTVTGAASGGYGDYRFSVEYKTASDTAWKSGAALTSNTELNFTPETAGAYSLRLAVRDAKGKNAYKYVKHYVRYEEDLTNNMTVSDSELTLGNTLTVTGAASGGFGDYRFSVEYKTASDNAWKSAAALTNNTELSFTPEVAGAYSLRLTVRDAKGRNAYKYVKLLVRNEEDLENNMTVSDSELVLGNTLTVTGAASGGYGDYRFSVEYKTASDTAWRSAASLTNNTELSFTPEAAGAYSLRLTVRDAKGRNAYKYVKLLVRNEDELKNNMTVSDSVVTLGNTLTVTGAASGGYGDYRYAVEYKTKTDTEWKSGAALTSDTELSFTPDAAGTYSLRLTVRDAKGKNAYKYVSVKVTET